MKLRVKFRAEDQHRTYCRYFRTILLFWWNIFDDTNIHRTAIYRKTFNRRFFHNDQHLPYFQYNLCKKVICNVIGLAIVHFSEGATGGVLLEKHALGNFAKFTGKHFWSFSCLLLKISWLFHSNRKMRWKRGNTLMELKYLLFCSSIELFDVKDFKINLTDGNLIRKCV